jgi:hypothetical protein
LKILSDGNHAVHTVRAANGEHEIITCYIAYACLWQHPSGLTFECDIAEDVIRSIPEYKPRVDAYHAIYE